MAKPLSVILLTQKRHGDSLIEAVAHFTGELPPNTATIALLGNESQGEIESCLQNAVDECAGGALILCDLFGSTHAAIAVRIARNNKKLACICGLNLAMLMETCVVCNLPLKTAAARVAKAGREAVVAGL